MKQTLLTTPRFAVERKEFPREGRKPVVRDIVVHPGAVIILPLLDPDRVVMTKNYRYTIERDLFELPAGTREPNEEPIETAARELEEETGYRAGKLTHMAEFYTSPGIMTERMYAFIATELEYVGARPEDNEMITVEITFLDRIRELIVEGKLEDGKTIAVLGMYLAQKDAQERNDARKSF